MLNMSKIRRRSHRRQHLQRYTVMNSSRMHPYDNCLETDPHSTIPSLTQTHDTFPSLIMQQTPLLVSHARQKQPGPLAPRRCRHEAIYRQRSAFVQNDASFIHAPPPPRVSCSFIPCRAFDKQRTRLTVAPTRTQSARNRRQTQSRTAADASRIVCAGRQEISIMSRNTSSEY